MKKLQKRIIKKEKEFIYYINKFKKIKKKLPKKYKYTLTVTAQKKKYLSLEFQFFS